MIHRWTLPNGLTCLYQESRDIPLAAGTLFFRSGSRYETLKEAGVGSFTIEMLMQGTRRQNARAIADQVESIGASMGFQSFEDYAESDFLTPAIHIDRILDLMLEVLREPSWPAIEITKEKEHVLSEFKTRHDAIFNVAYDRFRSELFGDHPYSRLTDGNVTSVRLLTKKDLVRWHARYLHPERTVFSLIGPWPARTMEKKIVQRFSGWKSPKPQADPVPSPIAAPTQFRESTEQASFKQAYWMSGTVAPAMQDAAMLPTKLFNMILGGGMSSRLFVELREKRGLAYEVSSFYASRRDAGTWAVYLGLPFEKLGIAETALAELLEDLSKKGPTKAEMEQARQMMLGSYIMDHQTRRRQAWYAGWWEFLGRPVDYDSKYPDRIRAITDDAIRSAGKALLATPRVSVKVLPK